MRFPGWRTWLVGLLPWLACSAAACRFEKSESRWVEAHGQGYFTTLAASSLGVAAVSSREGVYGYPGDWGRPWLPLWNRAPLAVAANDEHRYALTSDGELWSLDASASLRSLLRDANVTHLFGGRGDELFAIAGGVARRVHGAKLEPLACIGKATQLCARDDELLALKPDGSVWRERAGLCEPLLLDGPVDGIAATERAVYVLRNGFAHEVGDRGLVRLPLPRAIRGDGSTEERLQTLSASRRTLWGLTSAGHAFQLVTP